jgi:hypothetical protein
LFNKGIALPGDIVKSVRAVTTAVASGTGTIPADDTIPQSGEGNALGALDVALTPISACNYLQIEMLLGLAADTAAGGITAALFKDAEASAFSARILSAIAAGALHQFQITSYLPCVNGSSRTYKVRYGQSAAGTTTANGSSAARFLGGVVEGYMIVREIQT